MRNTRGAGVVSVHPGKSRSYSPHRPSTQRPSLRAARHAVARRALASMAHLAPARLRVSAVAVRFERVQTSGVRSNLLLPRPCASAPPTPRLPCTAGTGLRPVPASASAAPGSHGRPWSRSRRTMSRMASPSSHGGPRNAMLLDCIAMNTQLVKEGHNPSIERTCPGKPGHAAHVER